MAAATPNPPNSAERRHPATQPKRIFRLAGWYIREAGEGLAEASVPASPSVPINRLFAARATVLA
jgi:hypothetical protein